LNNFAQNWANNLAARDTMQHSTGSGYGENIYMKWSSDPSVTASGSEAVQSWYSEISKYTYGSGFSMGTGI
jgi:glioma pathogenesis-related protein 2